MLESPRRFAMTGIVNTAVGLGVIFAAKWLFDVGDLMANAAGYTVGYCCSFILNRNWTFQHEGRVLTAAFRFSVAVAIAYGLNLAAVFGLRDLANVNSYLAQAAGVIPYSVFLYVASRFYVFPRARV
jgi:putative flippase GtrA